MPFVVYEGDNLSTKSTQLALHAESLGKRYRVKTTKMPTNTELGNFARAYSLRNTRDAVRNFLLYLTDTTTATESLRRDLQAYDFVLCDRYFWTTLAVNKVVCAIDCPDSARGFERFIAEMLESGDLVYPDQTILFRVSFEEQHRRAQGREVNELDRRSMDKRFHDMLAAEYDRLSREYPGWISVDTDGKSASEIAGETEPRIIREPMSWGNPLLRKT